MPMPRPTTIPAACALWLLAGPVAAPAQETLWRHNGSVMRYQAEGEERMFFYHRPREGLERLKGRLLFYGLKKGRTLHGVAFLFRKDCRPAFYPVRGYVETPARIVLHGAAPDRGREGCAIRRWRAKGPGTRLVFTYDRRAPAGLKPPPPVPEETLRDIDTVIERPYRKHRLPVPGGAILITAPDYTATASHPLNIFVEAHCANRPPALLRRFLACALKGVRTNAAGELVLTTLPYEARTASCATVPHDETLPVGGACD